MYKYLVWGVLFLCSCQKELRKNDLPQNESSTDVLKNGCSVIYDKQSRIIKSFILNSGREISFFPSVPKRGFFEHFSEGRYRTSYFNELQKVESMKTLVNRFLSMEVGTYFEPQKNTFVAFDVLSDNLLRMVVIDINTETAVHYFFTMDDNQVFIDILYDKKRHIRSIYYTNKTRVTLYAHAWVDTLILAVPTSADIKLMVYAQNLLKSAVHPLQKFFYK